MRSANIQFTFVVESCFYASKLVDPPFPSLVTVAKGGDAHAFEKLMSRHSA